MKTKVLMVYPKIPHTFWNYDYILPYFGKKATFPPLGLLTVAALLPDNYEVRLIDMNAYNLSENDVIWADMVFISAMTIQQDSFNEVVDLCYKCKKKIVVGGSYIWSAYDLGLIPVDNKIDHLIFNEAEVTLPGFLRDYEMGKAEKIYKSDIKPDLTKTPAPRYDLIDVNDYWMMPLQFSRGCPFNCEFCDIIEMNGRQVRTKTPEQFIKELDALYKTGYVGLVFVVDDNFIGNIKKTKELIKKLLKWQKDNDYPFSFITQVSINLAHDDELLNLMSDVGFRIVFVGIETPNPGTLTSIQKNQNVREDLITSVRKIHSKRIMVMGGFIIGFDADTEAIFDSQIEFIQKAGIAVAMVGLLTAMPNTQLFRRLKKEKRLIGNGWNNGNNVDVYLNYIPKMPEKALIEGYKRVISEIYKPKNYYDRFLVFLDHLPKDPPQREMRLFKKGLPFYMKVWTIKNYLMLFAKEVFSSHGLEFIRFMKKAKKVNSVYYLVCIGFAANGKHYFKLAEKIVNTR